MTKKAFWRTEECNLTLLSKEARRFFEESDPIALDDIFGNCESIEEIEEVASEYAESEDNMLQFTERIEEGISGIIFVLENGIELYPNEWNGEVYTINENCRERTFKPVKEPISFDDDGEPEQWDIIGFEEI